MFIWSVFILLAIYQAIAYLKTHAPGQMTLSASNPLQLLGKKKSSFSKFFGKWLFLVEKKIHKGIAKGVALLQIMLLEHISTEKSLSLTEWPQNDVLFYCTNRKEVFSITV